MIVLLIRIHAKKSLYSSLTALSNLPVARVKGDDVVIAIRKMFPRSVVMDISARDVKGQWVIDVRLGKRHFGRSRVVRLNRKMHKDEMGLNQFSRDSGLSFASTQ